MQHHRKFQMIKRYGHSLRISKFHELEELQQEKYSQYFLTGAPSVALDNHQQLQQNESSEESLDQELIQNNEELGDEGEFDIAQYISTLSKRDREIFKKENSQLPAIMFMTKKEKKRYFDQINSKFQSSLDRTRQRVSKTKKILKFKNDFQVKLFCEKKNVQSLTKANLFREIYHKQIHFS